MTSILQQTRDAGFIEGRQSGEDWGRQLSMTSWDEGYTNGLVEAERNYPKRLRIFILGFVLGVTMAFGAIWYFTH